jgi:hypothetical protein
MFLCSKEEPVTNNESLYQRDSVNGQLILDQSEGRFINRYCFVHKNGDVDSEIPKLLKVLINQLSVKLFIILCWLVQIPGKSIVASKVIEKRYEKKLWNIAYRNSHYVAFKEIVSSEINTWPLLGVNPNDGGIILLSGNYIQNDILNIVNNEDSAFLAKNKYFAPDATFLSRLENTKAMALYQVNDELNNFGLVIIGNVTLDLKNISKNISIIEIIEGEDAYKIFI